MATNRARTSSESTVDVALKTINMQKQALVFVNSKRSAEKMAEDIASKLKAIPELEIIAEEAENALANPTRQCLRLSKCLKKGIAFHHAGLHNKQRQLIEDNFRDGKIKVIASTPTLAAGLDMPAFRVIIRDLKRYGGHWGMTPIPVLEYLQMAGRAGRPGKETFGEAITIAQTDTEEQDIKDTYIDGVPEKIYSKLAVEPVLRTYVLSLVASKLLGSEDELNEFFSKTFWAKQYQDPDKLKDIIARMIALLKDYGFITIDDKGHIDKNEEKNGKNIETADDLLDIDDEDEFDDFVSADKLIKDKDKSEKTEDDMKTDRKIRATKLGKRVAELYLDPLTANHIINCLRRAKQKIDVKEVNEFSFLQMISNTLEMEPLLKLRSKDYQMVDEILAENEQYLLQDEPSLYDIDFDDFQRSIKTTLFFIDWVNEKDDESLLERFNIRPGETRYKIDKAEWLFFASIEFCNILEFENLITPLRKIETRVKHGVKEELLPLLRLKQIGRARARILYNNNIKNLGDVRKSDLSTLQYLLGKKIGTNIKNQVSKEKIPIPKGTRKGQLSIEKFDR